MKKKMLMISYDFPPIGGGGVQRNVKFLKYLSQFGWDTSVLTIKERDFYVFDTTLLKEIEDTKIYRSNSLDPVSLSYKIKKIIGKRKENEESKEEVKINEGSIVVTIYRFIRKWFLLPDGFGGWIPLAYRKGKEIIKENRPDVLFCTFPVPSNAFVTYKLWKKFKIPFVIDFRDAWVDDPYTEFPSFFHKKFHKFYEKKVLSKASRVIVYGTPLKAILEEKYPNLEGRIEVITNGFDPEDFIDLTPQKKNQKDKIRLVYSGSVYIDRRETFVNFIEALKLIEEETLNSLEILFVGDRLSWITKLVNENKLDRYISFTGYLNHKEALSYLISADASLMFLKAGDKVALTGKIFEYIAVGTPIIACVEPDGACSKLLNSLDHDQGVCAPDNKFQIAEKVTSLIEGKLSKLSVENKTLYSRKYHSTILDKVLSEVINKNK